MLCEVRIHELHYLQSIPARTKSCMVRTMFAMHDIQNACESRAMCKLRYVIVIIIVHDSHLLRTIPDLILKHLDMIFSVDMPPEFIILISISWISQLVRILRIGLAGSFSKLQSK